MSLLSSGLAAHSSIYSDLPEKCMSEGKVCHNIERGQRTVCFIEYFQLNPNSILGIL